ncbi:unnamed protein product [Prunus armeniaca]
MKACLLNSTRKFGEPVPGSLFKSIKGLIESTDGILPLSAKSMEEVPCTPLLCKSPWRKAF